MENISSAIIDAFKGTTALANLMDAPVSTVNSWRTDGIPKSRLAHIKLLAEKQGIALPIICNLCEKRLDNLNACTDTQCPHAGRFHKQEAA